uniref:Putative cytochrome p450 2g1 n=1 Tax=Ixodes ricinus TaxID=34613 RepID=V5HAM1_IXORI
MILHVLGITAVGTLNGKLWQDNRRFCLHVLRDLGFGRKSMEEHIKEESLYLTEKIADTKGSPISIQEYLVPSMSNNISALVFGSRYLFDDPKP